MISYIRYNEDKDEFYLVFKGKENFDNFLNSIAYLTFIRKQYEKEKKIQGSNKTNNPFSEN